MATFHSLTVGLLMAGVTGLSGQNFNRPVPNNVPAYEFVRKDSTYQGYFLTAPFRLGALANSTPKPAMILDADGYLVWYMLVPARNILDFKYFPAQQRYAYIVTQGPSDIQFVLMDSGFQWLDSFTTVNGVIPDVHDFKISADQTYLLSGVSDSVMDLSAYLFNGVPGSAQTNARGFVVQELDKDHQLLFQWNSNDHIHPTKAYGFYGYAPAIYDYCHGNAIEEDPNGDLLLSFRNLNAIYKINRHNGQVMWELGGKSSSFSFPNDAGFSGQHDVKWLPNGNIALFDNANMAALPRISRAVEYRLDTVLWVAEKVWEYQYDPGFLSRAMGSHQITDDRLHLVNYGLNFRPNPSFVLVDDDGKVLSELFFQDSSMSYRSCIFDLPLDSAVRPTINCSQTAAGVTLSAPLGFNHYQWSNGANTASITVQDTGTYQVWVNHGAGMMGSRPFVIHDVQQGCMVSATGEPLPSDLPLIVGYWDLLGRQVSVPEQGRLYMVRYANGTSTLRFWVE